jgi:sec-independent protein translocase protein TatC
MIGVLSGKRLASAWRYIIFGVFVFAAVATPTGDPITMMMLAAPVMVLVGSAVVFSLLNDRRRRRNQTEPAYDTFDDDEASPLPDEDLKRR